MKYKHLAMIMGVMITATSVGSTATAFAADSKTESTQDADDTTEDTSEASDEKADDSKEETNENEILGEVKSVEDGKITIAIGTRKEMGQPGEQPQGGENDEAPDGNGDGQGAPDGEAPSMLDLTGEEQEITVTDSTVITKQSMGGGQGAPDGAGQTEEITLDDIKEGDVVAITLDDDGNAGTITDADGKTVSIVGTDGTTYVEGDSDYTITAGSYQDSADTSASTTVDDWSNYEVERPESL